MGISRNILSSRQEGRQITAVFVYLRVPAGGDHLEPDVAEGVEDHDGVGLDTDPVTGLAGRGGAGVAGTAGTVKLGL